MTLAAFLDTLDRIAPLRLAASWDNTGLLVEGDRPIRIVLLTIDLSPSVVDEALALDADALIAYHPPIFRPLTRLTRSSPHGSALLTLARHGIHLYSPHTALDAVPGGINDWLLEAFPSVQTRAPIEPDAEDPTAGAGRIATLAPTPFHAVLRQIKAHLALGTVRVAGPTDREVRRVAVCPGAGGSLFRTVDDCDLLLTGEMGHHDVLACVARGSTVVLSEHTHTERGYLPRYAAMLRDQLGVAVHLATTDADPLTLR